MKKLLLSLSILSFGICTAQNIFQDNLNSYTTGNDLSGQGTWTNNSSLPGGAGSALAGGPGATKVIATGMSYVNYGTSTKSRDIKINSDACGTPFTAVTSGDIYVAFLLNLATVQANNNSDFFRVMSGDNFTTVFRLYATPSGAGFNLGIAKGANGNAITTSTAAYNLNQDHLVIFKYSLGAGASDDVLNLYVDPVYANGVPITADATTSTGNDQVLAAGIDRLNFRHNWTNGMPSGRAGLISVARTWGTLTFNLSTDQFTKNTFIITSNEVRNGLLAIKSNLIVENGTLNIYDIHGRSIESKSISLSEDVNSITINPIQNTGIYIVDIITKTGEKFSQKITAK